MIGITKELSIRFVFAYRPDEFARALDWIVTGTVDVGAVRHGDLASGGGHGGLK